MKTLEKQKKIKIWRENPTQIIFGIIESNLHSTAIKDCIVSRSTYLLFDQIALLVKNQNKAKVLGNSADKEL